MPKIKVYRGRVHLFDKRMDGDEVVIGRSADAGIPLDSPAASRRHVRLTRRKWNWFAEHLGQKNPAMINKRPFTTQKLVHGDVILIAEHTLVFEYPRSEQRKEKGMFEGQAGASYRMGAGDIEEAFETGTANEDKLEAARQAAVHANATQAVSPDQLEKLIASMEKRRGAHLIFAAAGNRQEYPLEGRTHDIGWVDGVSVRLPGSRLFGKTGAKLLLGDDGRHRIAVSSRWVAVLVNGEAVAGDRVLADKDTVELKHFLGFGSAKMKYEAAVALSPAARRLSRNQTASS